MLVIAMATLLTVSILSMFREFELIENTIPNIRKPKAKIKNKKKRDQNEVKCCNYTS